MAMSVSVGSTAVDPAQASKLASAGNCKPDGDGSSFSSVLETSSEGGGGRSKKAGTSLSEQDDEAPNQDAQDQKDMPQLDGKNASWRRAERDGLSKVDAMKALIAGAQAQPDQIDDKLKEFEAQLTKFIKTAKTDSTKDDKADASTTETTAGPTAADLLAMLKDPQGASAALGALAALGGAPLTAKDGDTGVDGKDKDGKGLDGIKSKEPHAGGKDAASGPVATPAAQLPDTGEPDMRATTFRLSREDGTGQPISMRLGKEDSADTLGAAKTPMQDVTVVDARRFLGLMENKNSAAVTAAIAGDKDLARAIQPSSGLADPAASAAGKVVNTLKIQMTPENLGTVTATMRLAGDAISVDLKVETGAAYRQLKEDHSKIVEALRGQGYAVDVVSISMAPSPSGDTGTQSGQQGQGGQHQPQPGMQQGQGQQAPGRQQFMEQQRAGGSHVAEETGRDEASGNRPGSAGSVYL